MDLACSLHALPLCASLAFPSPTTFSNTSDNAPTFGENVYPNSSSTTIVPLMLGNLVAATGFPQCIASINVKSSPCGFSVGFKNTSNELLNAFSYDSGTVPSTTTLAPRSSYRCAHGPDPATTRYTSGCLGTSLEKASKRRGLSCRGADETSRVDFQKGKTRVYASRVDSTA
ncbi:hypothetical protein MUK42_32184 [Musa troglodytarum]|uniref:Uncharacterized protein n=1 Tax=Musa troglodytarum TaxID=320322 RepID=A0A9E7FGW1_9LILI|nr:hypothetical protein MUK42_32184 [Musa troglodytarum]